MAAHEAGRPWWASDGHDGLADEDPVGAHRSARAGEDAGEHTHSGRVDACAVCPVCATIRAIGETRPELISHLSEAARHLTLAAKAFIDAQADHLRHDDGLQRIPVDDE